ncbi:MAG: histidine kinase [Cyclobacteriaceae bacterium]
MREKYIKVLFHLFVILLMVLPSLSREGSFSFERVERFFFPVLTMIPFYFINIAYLIPRFLKKGKYGYYILSIIASYALFLLIHRATFQFLIAPDLPPMPDRMPRPFDRSPNQSFFRMLPGFGGFFFLLHFILMTLLGLCFEMIMEWEKQKRKYQETQKEKVSTELSFLKSQINPHFFFNTLNNIYALASAKSDDTERAILMLSQMMRYVLYEAGAEKILLSKEVTFIENYIALQKIRFSSKKAIAISFDVSGNSERFYIEPMLFLPIVENAFKHGISYKQKSFVAITLCIGEQDIQFIVENSKPPSTTDMEAPVEDKNSGIGLENIKKRLQLLYPGTHEFAIDDDLEKYTVTLKLQRIA